MPMKRREHRMSVTIDSRTHKALAELSDQVDVSMMMLIRWGIRLVIQKYTGALVPTDTPEVRTKRRRVKRND